MTHYTQQNSKIKPVKSQIECENMRPDPHLVSITDNGGQKIFLLGVYWDVGGEAVERNQTRAEAVTGPFSAELMRLD